MTIALAEPSVLQALGGPTSECWAEDEHAVLVCRQVLDVTHDVKSFHFVPERSGTFAFDPGQFVTLELEIDGVKVNRCYTISSPPTRPHMLAITVKRVPGGPVSNWLHDHLTPGTRISAYAPLGAFTITSRPAKKYLFLSAGSGITPLMSMTRTLFDLGSDADVLFVHSARTPYDIIFRRELDAIASVMPNFRVVHVCEADYPSERWMGHRGRLTRPMLESIAPDLAERVTFTCGPQPYMAAVRDLLEQVGYDFASYHEESFSFDSLPAGELPPAPEPPAVGAVPAREVETGFSVEFVKSGRTVTCGPDESILDAALTAGLRPPSSCSQGVCGTCKLTMLDGSVDMKHNGGIRPKEVAANKILICCSTPLSDVRVDA
jgi:glycine betaine catabolism B